MKTICLLSMKLLCCFCFVLLCSSDWIVNVTGGLLGSLLVGFSQPSASKHSKAKKKKPKKPNQPPDAINLQINLYFKYLWQCFFVDQFFVVDWLNRSYPQKKYKVINILFWRLALSCFKIMNNARNERIEFYACSITSRYGSNHPSKTKALLI